MAGQTVQSGEEDPFEISRAIRELFQGRSHAVGSVTLTQSATSTRVAALNCGTSSHILLTPKTANAAGAAATTYIKPADVLAGAFVVTHLNAGSTDRTFGYAIQG